MSKLMEAAFESQSLNGGQVSVVCVDDNPHVAEAVRITLERAGDFRWEGWLPEAGSLLDRLAPARGTVVILDVDMPGKSPFEVLEEISERFPQCRAIMFSGHVRYDLVERAIASGAWGYVSKSDGEEALVQAVREVCRDELAFSPEVRTIYGR